MLILSRRLNEAVNLRLKDGTLIRVMISGIKGAQIELGIEAPPEVGILRGELDAQWRELPQSVFMPHEYLLKGIVRAPDLPIFLTSEAVANFLTTRHDLRQRRLEWIEQSDPKAIDEWKAQVRAATARRSG